MTYSIFHSFIQLWISRSWLGLWQTIQRLVNSTSLMIRRVDTEESTSVTSLWTLVYHKASYPVVNFVTPWWQFKTFKIYYNSRYLICNSVNNLNLAETKDWSETWTHDRCIIFSAPLYHLSYPVHVKLMFKM